MESSYESIDTNVICRTILNDVPNLREKAITLLEQENIFYVPDQAITETVFVLETRRKIPRADIVKSLKLFLSTKNLRYNVIYFEQIFPMYLAHPKLSFNDCYLAIEAKEKNHTPLWTFDHKLALQSSSARQIP